MRALLILLPMMALAQVPEAIDRANEGVNNIGRPGPSDCPACAASAARDAGKDLVQCIAKICPNGTGYRKVPPPEALSNVDKDPKLGEVARLAIESILTKVREDDFSNRKILELLGSKNKISSPRDLRTAQFALAVVRGKSLQLVDDGVIDEQKTRDAYLAAGGSTEDFPAYMAAQKIIVSLSAKQLAHNEESFEDFSGNKTAEQRKAILSKMFAEHLAQEKTFAKEIDQPLDLMTSKALNDAIQEGIRDGELSEIGFEWLKTQIFSTRASIAVLRSPKFRAAVSPKPRTLGEMAKGVVDVEKLRGRIATLDKMKAADETWRDTEYGRLAQARADECAGAVLMGSINAPTPERLKEFLKEEKAWRREFTDSTKKLISETTAKALANAADNWKLNAPLDDARFLNDFRQRLVANLNAPQLNEERYKKLSPSQRNSINVSMVNLSERDPFEDIRAICKEKMPTEDDHASTGRNSFKLSESTATNPRFGKFTAFHEYAHMASQFIEKNGGVSDHSRKWFKDSRKCLNENRAGKKEFEEEDFATMVAGALVKDAENHQCAGEWTENEVPYFTLKDAEHDKLHSGPFYNIMNGYLASGHALPEICRVGLEAQGEKDMPKDCTQIVR